VGLFSRRSKINPEFGVPSDRTDAGLAALIAGVAVRLGATDARIEGSDASDLRILTGSQILPLFNLVTRLRETPLELWDPLISAHIGVALTGSPDTHSLDSDELRARIRTRLVSDFDSPVKLDYARPFAAGLVLALAVDYPQTVTSIADSDLPELALGVDELYEYGRRNVNAEPVDAHSEVAPQLFADEGRSLFVATRAADMQELLTRDGVDAPHGVLFTVPTRHSVIYTPISLDVLKRATTLVSFTQSQVSGQLGAVVGGPLSGNLYLWDAEGYECVGAEGVDDEIYELTITPRFKRALIAAGELPPD
jgi:hypothetical protein